MVFVGGDFGIAIEEIVVDDAVAGRLIELEYLSMLNDATTSNRMDNNVAKFCFFFSENFNLPLSWLALISF
jgi:hypothetical protein